MQYNKNDFLVDSHCHLNYLNDMGLDIDNVVKEATDNNVKIINNIGTNINDTQKIIDLANNYDNVYATVGHHPEELENGIASVEELLQFTNDSKIIGIGESGLDYHFRSDNRNDQIKNFESHIEVARITHLPLIIHTRDADSDMIDILVNEIKNGFFSFVLHCFSSSKELAYKALDLDGYISLSGIVTFKNATSLQDIVKNLPKNRLLIETDSPYLAPVPFRGKTNQPKYVKEVALFLSNIFGIDFQEIQSITTSNFLNLFNKIVV